MRYNENQLKNMPKKEIRRYVRSLNAAQWRINGRWPDESQSLYDAAMVALGVLKERGWTFEDAQMYKATMTTYQKTNWRQLRDDE